MSWTTGYHGNGSVPAQRVWEVLVDIGSWTEWNDGVERIEIGDEPAAVGTRFTMIPSDGPALHSSICELVPGRRITDLTVVDGISVRVAHEVRPHGEDACAVDYRIEVDGPAPHGVLEQIGRAVSADFPEVIAALIDRASLTR